MNNIEALTGQPADNCLFPFFWQHGENHDILGDYMERIAGCGMKGACIEARPHPDFVSDGWWHDMDFIIKKAGELGMKLWILDDSHFPTGFANGRIKESYKQYLKWYLAMRRYDVEGPMKGGRIDFRLLKGRPWDQPDPSEQIFCVCMAKRGGELDSINSETLTDITGQMRMEDRLLTIDVPDGAYSIFVVYLTRNGGEEATKDYLNPLIKEASMVLIDEVYEPHYHHYKEEFGNTILGFFSDEPRFGNEKGTEAAIGRPDMVLPWRDGLDTMLGFDRKYLPLLWTGGCGAESGIRFRYMDVITRLYNENFTKVLGDWCMARHVKYLGHTIEDNGAHARLGYGTGHYFRGQQDMDFAGIDVIGGQIVPGMNYHHDSFSTGGSDGEFYHYALARLASSAAHLDPKKAGRCMCEAFGAYGWNEGLKMMKWIADHLLVRGVNYFVPHAFDPKAFPDFDCPPHFYAHGHNPQFRYFPVFSGYLNRVAEIFRNGSHPAQAGVLYPAEFEWTGAYMPVEKPAKELTQHQISFDIVTIDYLQTARIGAGTYTINGECFSVLVIPYGECLPASLVPILRQLKDGGVRIIWLERMPSRVIGMEVDSVLNMGEVVSLRDLGTALSDLAAFTLSSPQPELAVGEYVRNGKKFYMIFNEHIGKTIHTRIAFREKGFLYRYDAFADRLYEVEVDMEGSLESGENESGIRLDLEPYESVIFVVSGEELAFVKSAKTHDSNMGYPCDWGGIDSGLKEVPLPAAWQVRYADSFSYPEFKEFSLCQCQADKGQESAGTQGSPGSQGSPEALCRVETIPGWERKTGTLRFEAEMMLEEGAAGTALTYPQAVLDLGEVYETAEVFINSRTAGVRICRPYRFDLSGLLRPGKNQIAIEVTNTLGTQIRDTISHYLMIEPFGIEGPVKLKIQVEEESKERD